MYNQRIAMAIIWAFALLSTALKAQVLIKSGDKSIRYDLVKSSHYFNRQTIFDTTGKIKNEWVNEYIVKMDSARNQILFVRSTQYAPGRTVVDSMINNSAGPVSYSLTTTPVTKQEVIKYNPTSVDSHLFRKGKYSDKNTAMAEGYFDDTSIWELFGYMTFKKGVKYYLNCYGSDERVPLIYNMEYVFDDMVYQNGTPANCHVVHVSYLGTSTYLWIDDRTHRTVKEVSQYRDFGLSAAEI